MLSLSGFELYPRWVPLVYVDEYFIRQTCKGIVNN